MSISLVVSFHVSKLSGTFMLSLRRLSFILLPYACIIFLVMDRYRASVYVIVSVPETTGYNSM